MTSGKQEAKSLIKSTRGGCKPKVNQRLSTKRKHFFFFSTSRIPLSVPRYHSFGSYPLQSLDPDVEALKRNDKWNARNYGMG